MTRHVLVVLSNAADGCDDEFNDWYDHQHLGDVLAVDGFVAAQRFRLSDAQLRADEPMPYRYLAVYEIEADDLNTPLQGLISGIASGAIPLSEALDLQRLSTYTLHADHRSRDRLTRRSPRRDGGGYSGYIARPGR